MKKKIFNIILLIIAITIAGTFILSYLNKKKYENSIYDISNLNYKELTLEGTPFYEKEDYNCFILFKTDNENCYNQIEDFVDEIEKFRNINFYLVSNESYELLKEFHEDSDYEGLENFTVLQDRENKLHNFFNNKEIPSLYIYNKSGKLINYSIGYTDKINNLITLH